MTEEAALLHAILEHPAEDTPRLVYADWLDECATPKRAARAEFIRAQVALANPPECETPSSGATINGGPAPCRKCRPRDKRDCVPWCAACQRCDDLGAREAALLKKWGAAWLPKSLRPSHALPLFVDGSTVPITSEMGFDGYVRFARGFIEHAGCEFAVRAVEDVSRDAFTFGEFVAALFRGNPLTCISVSFAVTNLTLHAEIGRAEPGDAPYPWWLIGWSSTTNIALPNNARHAIDGRETRDGLTGVIPRWLANAIRRPAELAIEQLAATAPGPVEYIDPDPDPFEQGEYEPGYD